MIGDNSTISVFHANLSSSPAYNPTADIEGVSCYIEQLDPLEAQMYGGQTAFQTFEIHISNNPIQIKEGDKVVDEQGFSYIVKGVERNIKNEIPDYFLIVANRES